MSHTASAGGVLRRLVACSPRVLRPQRARLDEARRIVAGRTGAADAWSGLAAEGVIPGRWLDDPRRRFGPRSLCGGERCRLGDVSDPYGLGVGRCEDCVAHPVRTRLRARPVSRQMCVRMAADVSGVERAEALAREASRRLEVALGRRTGDVVLWRAVDARSWQRGMADDGFWKLENPLWVEDTYGLQSRLFNEGPPEARVERSHRVQKLRDQALVRLGVIADARSGWGSIAPAPQRGAVCVMAMAAYRSLEWRLTAELCSLPLDPFEPMVELFATGYALEAISSQYLVLGTPRWSREPG